MAGDAPRRAALSAPARVLARRPTATGRSSTPRTRAARGSLIAYLDIADEARRRRCARPCAPRWSGSSRSPARWRTRSATRASSCRPGGRARDALLLPHDTETAPWWQGEDARLGSLAFAARAPPRSSPTIPPSPAACAGTRRTSSTGSWARNPFDASLSKGAGHDNPEYGSSGPSSTRNAPGGIVNGITAASHDPQGIDFNLPHTATGGDNDWRWGEQWLPHATWYLLALAAGEGRRVRPTGA
jgi:hypothetical protein